MIEWIMHRDVETTWDCIKRLLFELNKEITSQYFKSHATLLSKGVSEIFFEKNS